MFWLYVFIFIISGALFYLSGEWVVGGLMRIAKFLGWKEFVVAFFVMAFAASLPNFLVGITSALKGIPQLSFGDVSGNNLAALTVAVALAAFFTKDGLPAESRTIQTTSIFTMLAAVFPLILVLDKTLSRIDGFLLIAFFIFYTFWLFSKKERFSKNYTDQKISILDNFRDFLKDMSKVALGILLLIVAAQGVVSSAQFFAGYFNVPLVLIGILVTGAGSSLPEIYFAIASARKGETWMILGNLMGAVVVPSTLVLGTVALIHPIQIPSLTNLAIARLFLAISAIGFLICVRTHRKVTKGEAFILLLIFIFFIILELSIK